MNPTTITDLSVKEIVPGNNDRTIFAPADLAVLADSIRENGLIQPISVRAIDGTEIYEIIAGERRFRACRDILGWETIPAIIRDMTAEEASAAMLSENTARHDLDPIEEAVAYQRRMAVYGWTVAYVAQKAGVSETRVHFRIKLLKLRPDVQHLVRSGALPLGYAQIMSDSDLDTNRQLIAVQRYNTNPDATPGWFRSEVKALAQQQDDTVAGGLWNFEETDFSAVSTAPQLAAVTPPRPGQDTPPAIGDTLEARAKAQVEFWTRAAEGWQALGKPFERRECEAAAAALSALIAS